MHRIQVAADSFLSQVMNATDVTAHSGHHQPVKDVAQKLVVVASAADGIPEALAIRGW
jgi:gamma-glutamyl-gamma-aminobutyrate hydrolase PuuD